MAAPTNVLKWPPAIVTASFGIQKIDKQRAEVGALGQCGALEAREFGAVGEARASAEDCGIERKPRLHDRTKAEMLEKKREKREVLVP